MNNLFANVKKIWREAFSALWQTVLNDRQLLKKPPALCIEFSDNLNAKRGARLTGNAAYTIEVSSQFALNLHRELRRVKNGLASLAFDSASAQRTHCGEVLAVVEQLTVGFIVLHEIFHLIGGHFDWLKAKPSSRWTFKERYQKVPPNWRTKPSYSAIADAYLLESEADCSAIQWMLQVMSARELQRLLQTRTGHIQFFFGRRRLAAFRLLLASVWLAIRRLESAREELKFNNSARHPLPVTRVFAAFGTFLMHYSYISNVRFDAQGGAQRTLTDDDVNTIRKFIQHILIPVLKCDWNPASPNLPPESLEAQLRFYLRDYGNHLLNKPVETIAGRELIRMERARFRMDRSLRSFRYYRSAKLERMAGRRRTGRPARHS
jgi:hypothetical protein